MLIQFCPVFSAPPLLVHTRLVQCRKRGHLRKTFEHSQWKPRVQWPSERAEISQYNCAFCKKNPSRVTLLNDQLWRQFPNLFWIPPLFSFSVASPNIEIHFHDDDDVDCDNDDFDDDPFQGQLLGEKDRSIKRLCIFPDEFVFYVHAVSSLAPTPQCLSVGQSHCQIFTQRCFRWYRGGGDGQDHTMSYILWEANSFLMVEGEIYENGWKWMKMGENVWKLIL